MTRDPNTKPVVVRDDDGLPWCPESELCPWFETPEESGGQGWAQFCSKESTQISADAYSPERGHKCGYLCKDQMIIDHKELIELRSKTPH